MSDISTRATHAPSAVPAALAAGAALALWSGTAVANKIAVNHMDALTAGVLRSMLAGVFALVIAVSMRLPFPESWRERALLAVAGLSSFAVWPALMSIGIARTTAGHAALIMALTPVFTVLIAAVVERRRPHGRWWLGAAAAFAGTAVLIGGRGLVPDLVNAEAGVTGNLIVLAGGVICALGYVTGARLSTRIGTVATTFWGLSIALSGLVPTFAVIATETAWHGVPMAGWLAIAWMAVLSSLAGYALWFFALGRGGIGRIGSLQLGLPVLTLTAAALVLDEAITPPLLISALVVVSGTWIAHAAERAHA